MQSPSTFPRCSVVCRWALVALAVLPSGCDDPRPARKSCNASSECGAGMVCSEYECVKAESNAETVEEANARARRMAERERIVELEKQVDLLRQSGVEPELAVEEGEAAAAEPSAGAQAGASPGAVRVSTTKGASPIFAACRRDERLLGGGCRAETSTIALGANYPSGHNEHDTVGARWNCEGRSSYTPMQLEAYALCLRLDAAPGE